MAKILNKDPFTYQQEKDEFMSTLKQFHRNRGTPIGKNPVIGGKEVDMYLLYRQVIKFGGWRKINDEQIWENFLSDFKIPGGCSNGTQALKFIYVRYLDAYEKVYFHGADPNQRDDEDSEGPLRKKACLPLFGIPHSYNYDQHKVSDHGRSVVGMSTDFVKTSDYHKLEKALMSGFPNEVDFAINVCTLLSSESRHSLLLRKAKNLLQLLMAHIGIFSDDNGTYEEVYEQEWRKLSNKNFIHFWFETVSEETIRGLVHTNRGYAKRELLGQTLLNLGQEAGIHDQEGQRVMQLAVIIRNLSFEEENMKFMSENDLVFRFLMLCIHSSYGSLRQLALDSLGNIAEKFVLTTDDHSHLVLQILKQCLSSDDKYEVVRGLEILSKLCLLDENEDQLTESLEDALYADIVRLMNVFDIQIIVYSLEALYQLSELGEHTTTKIAAVKHAVDLLVSLLTIEAQSYGANSLVGIKVVEYCPPLHMMPGVSVDHGQASVMSGTPGHPVSQPLPPSHKTAQPQMSTTGCDVETTTYQWLQSTFELKDGSSLPHVHMYAEYLNFAKKFSLPQILSSNAFASCVKVVFPNLEQYSTEKAEGVSEAGFKGICKRKTPLPFAIPSTGGAVPTTNQQQSAIYTATKPLTQTSNSNSKSAQNQPSIMSVGKSPQPKTQQALKQHLNQASPTQMPVLPQQTGPPNPTNQQGADTSSETRMIKNLLAKKLKVQQSSPIPIAPKQTSQPIQAVVDPSNPMHLLTFTTQQSTHIQGQLQQAFVPVVQDTSGYTVTGNYYDQANLGQTFQIQGVQSFVDGTQQIVIPQATVSSQPSLQTGSPISDKSKGASKNNASRNSSRTSRSSSPKGTSPKRKPSSRSSSPRNYDLDVCGEVERAKDVVKVGLEARIERIENNSLKQIQSVNSTTPSTSHLVASSVTPPNAVMPGYPVVGSTNTGVTGNIAASFTLPSQTIADNTTLTLQSQLNCATSSSANPTNQFSSESIPNCSDSSLNPCSITSSIPQPSIASSNTPSFSPEDNKNTNSCESALVVKEKPKMNYICTQDETDAAVSSLLITEEDTQQSLSNGSDTDVPLTTAIVSSADETAAAISAIEGMLEEEPECEEDDIPMDEDLMEPMEETSAEEMPVLTEEKESSETTVSENAMDVGSKKENVTINGVNSPEENVIPSPTEEQNHMSNGISESESEEGFIKSSKHVMDKIAMDKLTRINGIDKHLGNGGVNHIGIDSPVKEDKMELSEDSTNGEVIQGEIDQAISGILENGTDILENGEPKETKCYELAGESETEDTLTPMEEEEEVLIENEMCLQPTTAVADQVPPVVVGSDNTEEVESIAGPVTEENSGAEVRVNGTEETTVKQQEENSDECKLPVEGCVDILKAAIESEKIDECVLNGDSNDSLPPGTIYPGEIQISAPSIPIGNEMTATAVGSNNINLIQNVFTNVQTVQTGLVVGTIVSVNNNLLTTATVPLTLTDNIVGKKMGMEMCPERHVPTPEASRDGELSCDSIASTLTDSSDKHSITFQQPILSVQNFPTNVLGVQTMPVNKSQQYITTVITTPKQTSPRTRDKRAKKRSRNASSGSADSRCSNSSSTIAQPMAPPPPTADYICEWQGCKQCFENFKHVFKHVLDSHLKMDREGYCRWEGCERLQRKKWSLVTHVQDHHCSENALKSSTMRRKQSQQSGTAIPPQTVPALVYPTDAAWQAIRRFSPKPPYPEFTEAREGPVTKHIRLTAALILRNLARYSAPGRSLIKKYERRISFSAMSALESSNALANCLFEILHDH
ncbi:AT-rich interactive domain-containing protein 2-like isoform X2 [Saccostrea echinata]|uniref:AT-rich interactive domain-containing protein 2-like isoform X2 n=1 Tax=Saccostrea echinata TaxID=191078 RepID=UPI002A7EABE5|nr:AT-rich interactive domain-containing protein 2-like isoform X2 [Saccostrea echinata]